MTTMRRSNPHWSACSGCPKVKAIRINRTGKVYKVVTPHGAGASRISSVKQPGRRYGPAPKIRLA